MNNVDNMKRVISFFILLLASYHCIAQSAKVLDDMALLYNQQKFSEMYAQYFNESFKANLSQNDFVKFLNNIVYKNFGVIKSYKIQDTTSKIKSWLLIGQNSMMQWQLELDNHFKFNYFQVLPYKPSEIYSSNTKDNSLAKHIDSIVTKHFEKGFKSDLSIAVIVNDTVKKYFYSTTSTLPTDTTYYEIGSLTKTFTAWLIAKAIEENKLSLNEDIRNYLPLSKDSLKNLQFKDYNITIKNLITHTSGISRVPSDLSKQKNFDINNPYKNYTYNQLFNYLKTLDFTNDTSAAFNYSNTGYALLGIILENIYKDSLQNILNKNLLNAYQLNHTKLKLSINEKLIQGFNSAEQPAMPWDMDVYKSAGAIKSNLNDLIKYMQMHLNNRSVFATTHHILYQDHINTMGYAWFITSIKNKNVYWHNGATFGYYSFAGFSLDKKIAVVILSNSGKINDFIGVQLLRYLLTIK